MCLKQVAQLWQRDRAKLDTFSINVQRCSQDHAQNCIFGPFYEGVKGNIGTLSERFNAKKLCSSFNERMSVLLVKQRISVSEPPFGEGGLTGIVCDSSFARLKARSQLPIGHNWTFSLALTAEALIRRNRPVLKGWVTMVLNIRLKGYVYRQYLYTVR